MSRKKIIWGLIFLVIAFAAIYAYKEYTRTNKDLSGVKADVIVESSKLISDYELSDTAANNKYLGKILEVSGIVKNVESAEGSVYTVVLGEKDSRSSVRCQMDSTHSPDAAKLATGSSVTMRGACTGFEKNELLGENLGSDVHMNRCVVVNVKN